MVISHGQCNRLNCRVPAFVTPNKKHMLIVATFCTSRLQESSVCTGHVNILFNMVKVIFYNTHITLYIAQINSTMAIHF